MPDWDWHEGPAIRGRKWWQVHGQWLAVCPDRLVRVATTTEATQLDGWLADSVTERVTER